MSRQITLNIDNRGYAEKPKDQAEIGGICNRVKNRNRIITIDIDSLLAAIDKGITFTPGELAGTTAKDWKSQQLFVIDVDNEEFERDENGALKRINGHNVAIPVKEPTTPRQALSILESYSIHPFAMYHTFSNKPGWERFRVLILAEKKITDPEKARSYSMRLAGIIPNADTGIHNLDRLIYAGKPGCIIYKADKVTTIDALNDLPEVKPQAAAATETIPSCLLYADSIKPIDKIKAGRTNSGAGLTTQEQAERLRNDIKNFDLMRFICENSDAREVTVGRTHYAAPCPVCGRTSNHLHIRGNSWQCYDSYNTTGHKGGTIIDYLMAVYGLTKAQAMDKFEFDIMGYDRQERKEAYKAEQAAAEDKEINEKYSQHKEEKKMQEPVKSDIQSFLEKVQGEAYRPFATGLSFFDDLLSGGVIRETLLLLTAAPGAGKTTLAQTMAEKIAENGHRMLYINLEMTTEQMLAKALSLRMTRKGFPIEATTILQGYKWAPEQRERIMQAAAEYEQNIRPYIEYRGISSKSENKISVNIEAILKTINAEAEKAEAAGQEAPAVVLDYLHLVKSEKKLEVQDLIKACVYGLKEYAEKHHTFVLAITAASRSASEGRMGAESGRDSSNLEYTGDYLLSLNYDEVDNGNIDIKTLAGKEALSMEKREEYRRMILRLDKNRFGQTERYERLYFNARYNTYYGEYEQLPAGAEIKRFNKEKKQPGKRY